MIDQAQAIEIAKKHAAENDWGFDEPIGIAARRGKAGSMNFEIETNAGSLGTKALFVISETTGEIISSGYISR